MASSAFLRSFLNPPYSHCIIILFCLPGAMKRPCSRRGAAAVLLSQASWNPAALHDLQFHLMNRFALDLHYDLGCCYKPQRCWWVGMSASVKQGETLFECRQCYGPLACKFHVMTTLLHKRVITVGIWVTNTQIKTTLCIGTEYTVLINTGLRSQKT